MGHNSSNRSSKRLLRKFKMMLYFAVTAIFVGLAYADDLPDVVIPDVCYQKKVGDTYTCFARTGKVCVTHFNSTDPCGQHAGDCEVPCDEQENSCLQRWGDCMAKPVQRDRYDCRNALLNTNACSQAFLTPVEMVIVMHLVRRKFLNVDGWSWIAQKLCVKSKPTAKWIHAIK